MRILSFLSARSQICNVNGELSSLCHLTKSIIQWSGIGPTLYVVMESDLRPKFSNNILFNVEIVVEYQNVKDWTRRNGMVINELKT